MSGKEKPEKGGKENQINSTIWRLATKDVTPLPCPENTTGRKKGPKPGSQPDTMEPSVSTTNFVVKTKIASSLEKSPAASPAGKINRQPLSSQPRKKVKIEARIDLHGLTQEKAHTALHRFLFSCHEKKLRLVLVITGKGLKEEEQSEKHWTDHRPGILRRRVPEWLRTEDLERIVDGFQTAEQPHGGEGALYVRLKKKSR